MALAGLTLESEAMLVIGGAAFTGASMSETRAWEIGTDSDTSWWFSDSRTLGVSDEYTLVLIGTVCEAFGMAAAAPVPVVVVAGASFSSPSRRPEMVATVAPIAPAMPAAKPPPAAASFFSASVTLSPG